MFSHVGGSVDSLETGYEPLLGPIEEIPAEVLPVIWNQPDKSSRHKAKRMVQEGGSKWKGMIEGIAG